MPTLPACEHCRFWDNSVAARDHDDSGRCSVLPPTIPFGSCDGMGVWPFTLAADSCGSFQRKGARED
jgi:hypothetical protein